MSRFALSGRYAVVTGALGQLGPVWTDALLSAGANVVGLDRPGVPVPAPFAALQDRYREACLRLYRADVRERAELREVCDRCLAEKMVPSVLVNNAGIDQPPGPTVSYRLEDVPFETCREVFDVNALGALQVMQVFGGEMVKAGRGSIINIGSLYAEVSPDVRFYEHIACDPPFLKPPAYGASKAALVNLTKYFATHWGP